MSDIISITGTDTGVGKTLVTSLLTVHLRQQGQRVCALKPYCSGGREDIELLALANGDSSSEEQINSVYCEAPLSPLAALGEARAESAYRQVIADVRARTTQFDIILVEGVGGLEAPLSAGKTVSSLICELGGRALIVAKNQLGMLSQVALVEQRLFKLTGSMAPIIVSGSATPDLSAESNVAMLAKTHEGVPLYEVPWLGDMGPEAARSGAVVAAEKKLRKTLAGLWESLKVRSPVREQS